LAVKKRLRRYSPTPLPFLYNAFLFGKTGLKFQILVDGKARGGEIAQRTSVREHFSTTSNAAIGQNMEIFKQF
jgi:hypothetical protein